VLSELQITSCHQGSGSLFLLLFLVLNKILPFIFFKQKTFFFRVGGESDRNEKEETTKQF